MKNTKIVALVAAVALLVIGAAFTSFAAQYNWYDQDGEWRCKDKNGDDYYDAWAKSGADWYWLNDEGFMARETLVDEDKKYVDADGKMVKNDWKQIADEEGDLYWYYFQVGGQKLAAKEGAAPKPVTVNGKKYIFNEAGQMCSGWVQPGFEEVDDEDYAWQTGIYYCGDADDGAVTYGWKQIECYNEAEDFVDNNYWFWFDTAGKKFKATDDNSGNAILKEKKINGKNYAFNQYGVMKAEWEQTVNTASDASTNAGSYAWFQDAEIGAKFANGWFRVVPSDSFDYDNNYEETAKWFYAKSGKLAQSTIKTIAGKKYAFNADGEMITGLNKVVIDTSVTPNVYTFTAIDETNLNLLDGVIADFRYFSDDEDNDGSMKTGVQKVTVDGDDYDFYFSTKNGSKGVGISGKQGNKYYYNGKKIAADDAVAEYQFFASQDTSKAIKDAVVAPTATSLTAAEETYGTLTIVDAHKYALIGKTGTVATSGTKKDGNGNKYTFKKKVSDSVLSEGYWVIDPE